MPDSARLRVGYDATSLLGTLTGVGYMTDGMITALAQRDDVDVRAFAVTWRGRKGLRDVVPAGTTATVSRPFPARLGRRLWPHVEWPGAEYWTGPVDVVHAPNFVAPPSRAPGIVTVHDLAFVRFPELCSGDSLTYDRMLRVALDRGVTVHTFSEFVAREVTEHFSLPPERVVRVPPGLTVPTPGDPQLGRARAGADRYVLALGTVEPRKNLPALVRAYDAIAGDHPDLFLVVAGPDGWGTREYDAAVSAATHRDRIRRLGYVGDRDRRALLAGAAALAYPSLYEGFGLPPLEALQSGTPVVASDRASLPEVLGDAALLVAPDDHDGLAGALEAVLDPDVAARLVANGRARTQRYTWQATGEGLVELYTRLAREGAG